MSERAATTFHDDGDPAATATARELQHGGGEQLA